MLRRDPAWSFRRLTVSSAKLNSSTDSCGRRGVFREGSTAQKALDVVRELQQRYKSIGVQDTGAVFNTDILEAWELGCLLDLAEVTALSALNRTESRGAHWREDFPKRDDVNWMKHTFVTLQDGKQIITYKPVTLTKFEPKERKY